MGRTARIRYRLKFSPRPSLNLASNPDSVELAKWMSKHDWSPTCRLTPARFPDTGRGFRAERDIEAGSTIVSIPATLLITTSTVADSPVGELIRRSSVVFTAQFVLSTFLLFERSRGSESPWFHYINSIPKRFETPPYMTELELSLLPAYLSRQIALQRETLSANFASLLSLTQAFNYRDFLWAWFSVNSRSVYLASPLVSSLASPLVSSLVTSEEDCLALAPYLDIFNHSDSARMEARLDPSGRRYEILTLVPFPRRSQVFINYGPHSNLKLLLEYGFVLPSNSCDAVDVTYEEVLESAVATCPEAFVSTEKLSFVEANGMKRDLYVGPGGVSYNVASLIHTLLASRREFSSRAFARSLFSRDFGPRRETAGRALVAAKREEAMRDLERMDWVLDAGDSFNVAKDLIGEYVKLLERL